MWKLLLCFVISKIVSCSCPDGYELVSSGQCRGHYGMVNVPWNDATNTAIAKCSETQSTPIIIHNAEEQSYWKAHANSAYTPLGLVCNTTSKRWEWADGSAVDYKPPEGYDYYLDKDCTYYNGYQWYLYPNKAGYWYFDSLSSSSTIDIFCINQLHQPVIAAEGCYGFDEDNDDGVCYQIGTHAQSWQEAQLNCKQLGANLASVHSANENSFIRRLAVSKGAVHGVFLGATLSGKGQNFGWIDGSSWDYTNFYPGFPKSGFGDCVALDTSTTAGQWMNVDCAAKMPVVCVRDRIVLDRNVTCSADVWEEEAIMTSPGFPFNASMPCEYYLEVEAGKKVELEVALLEANSCCDFLTVYDGYFGGYILANLTGEVRNATYTTSDSNIMRVSWQPKGGVNVRGVAMSFRGV